MRDINPPTTGENLKLWPGPNVVNFSVLSLSCPRAPLASVSLSTVCRAEERSSREEGVRTDGGQATG